MTDLITKLEHNLAPLSKMYDIMRLVDPVRKRVVQYQGQQKVEKDDVCYHYWGNGKICDNCISMRAYADTKCYQKLEQSRDAILMVTAIPIENTDGPVVVELLKNATDTMMIGTGEYGDGRFARNVITEMNDRIVRDSMTGLYNRRFVNDRLSADIVRATLEGIPLSILFVDIDDLKQINDTYGHAVGDRTIVGIADVFRDSVRRSEADWVARYGGDEFLICLSNSDKVAALAVAERIHGKISALYNAQDEAITTTTSIGLYTMHDEVLTPDELIALADKRMYQAKQKGKNRIVDVDHNEIK